MKIDTNALIMAQVLGGGGSSVTVEPLSVTANGEYTAPTGKAYSPVTVNVAKPDYLISDGDNVSTFYFNTAYALGTWLATLTYSDLDPDTGLYVCYTGLGYFFGVDLTSGQYALVWNDGVNIVPIYSTVAVPAFGVTEAGWQMTSYTPSVTTTVVESQFIPELSEVIDDVVAEDSIAFGSSTLVPVIGVWRNCDTSNTDGPSGSHTLGGSNVPFKAGDVIRAYAVQKRSVVYGQTANVAPYTTDVDAEALSAEDLNFTAGDYDWTSNISYTFTKSSTVTNPSYNTYVLIVLFKAPDEFKARLNSDGTFDFIQTRDADHNVTIFENQGTKTLEFIPDVQVFKRAVFESGVTSVPNTLLYGRGIEEIVFPSSLTTIGSGSFSYCRSLKSITIPSTITSVGQNIIRNSGVKTLTVETTNCTYDTYAYANCNYLENVYLPNGMTEIGKNMFSADIALHSLTIPSTVTTIKEYAFYNSGIQSIDLPSSVTTLERFALGTSTLASITCRATTPPTIESTSFYNVPASCPIYVPAASVSAYKAATNWSSRASYIQAIPS